jgi:integrase
LESPLSSLTPRRCDNLYHALATSGACAAGTHHLALSVARRFGRWCAHRRQRWIRENPFEAVEKIGEAADHRSESLRIDEARAFRTTALELAASGDVGAISTLIALTCSLRPSEIVQIAARDVDDGGAVLWVAGAKLKTQNTRRPISVEDNDLRGLLVRLSKGRNPDDLLIPHHPRYVARAGERIAAAAGVPTVNARILRRTFATLAARRGRSLDDLAFSMGHGADANARTAQRHYVAPGAKQAGAAGRMLSVLDGGKRK